MSNPEIDDFRRRIEDLRSHALLRTLIADGHIALRSLSPQQVADIDRDDAGHYFLLAAAGLNRTSLRAAQRSASVQIAPKELRRATAIQERLPVRRSFDEIAHTAVALRSSDLGRKQRGEVERRFRERLEAERIPICMSPPVRFVPGLLIGRRKPDGVFPDPRSEQPPILYLEIKSVRRVSDDIQKRLYEIVEASLEMKLLYGSLTLRSLGVRSTREAAERIDDLRAELGRQLSRSPPIVVLLLLCSRGDAGRYRAAAEAFVDRVFFQEEIDECIEFLRGVVGIDPRSA